MKKGISLKKKYEIAKSVYDSLIKWKMIGDLSYLKIGQLLKKIKEERLYKYLGSDSEEYEDFETFLKTPEINMELRKAYYLIQIWTIFVERFGFKPEELSDIHWTSLRALLPVARKENVQELIEKARNLTRAHLEMEVKALKNGLTELGECSHPKIEEVHYYRCISCGEHFKVPPKGSEVISKNNLR